MSETENPEMRRLPVYSVVHTSEYEMPSTAAGPDVREALWLEAARRPGTRPTEYWSVQRVLELLGPLGLSHTPALPSARSHGE